MVLEETEADVRLCSAYHFDGCPPCEVTTASQGDLGGWLSKMAAAEVEFVKIRGQNVLEWLLNTAVLQQKFGVFFFGLDDWVLRDTSTVASGYIGIGLGVHFPWSKVPLQFPGTGDPASRLPRSKAFDDI
jgi:hypothetical protein